MDVCIYVCIYVYVRRTLLRSWSHQARKLTPHWEQSRIHEIRVVVFTDGIYTKGIHRRLLYKEHTSHYVCSN